MNKLLVVNYIIRALFLYRYEKNKAILQSLQKREKSLIFLSSFLLLLHNAILPLHNKTKSCKMRILGVPSQKQCAGQVLIPNTALIAYFKVRVSSKFDYTSKFPSLLQSQT